MDILEEIKKRKGIVPEPNLGATVFRDGLGVRWYEKDGTRSLISGDRHEFYYCKKERCFVYKVIFE